MTNLSLANQELYRRTPDECFESLESLAVHCQGQKERAQDCWKAPLELDLVAVPGSSLSVQIGTDGACLMNDWSFGQLCRLAGVAKETINRLRPETARQVFSETLPRSNKPLQLFTQGDLIRSIHGTGYTRLYNADVVEMLRGVAVDFEPPQKAFNGATGLVCGGAGYVLLPHRPVGLDGNPRRSIRSWILRLELGSRSPLVRRADLLAPSRVPKPHRLGCRGGRGVFPQAHRERQRIARRDAAAH